MNSKYKWLWAFIYAAIKLKVFLKSIIKNLVKIRTIISGLKLPWHKMTYIWNPPL